MIRNRDGYGPDGRRLYFLDMGGDAPAPTDTRPMAEASEAAARIGAEQGDRVLAESKRQYDRNMEVADPIIKAQTRQMESAQKQGDEYYDYWKTKAQPVEDALNTDAMAAGTDAKIEEAAARAAADARVGQTQQANMLVRQGLRYGYAPAKMLSAAGTMAGANASTVAGAMTGARDKEKALGVAKKLDVAGLYRGMPGASTGAYGAAINAGNSAVNNSTTVGNGLTAGTAAAGGLVMQGQGMRLQGLGNVLNSQQQTYNSQMQANNANSAGMGSLLGIGLKFGLNYAFPGAGAAIPK